MGCKESNQTIKTLQFKKMNVYLFKVSVVFGKVNSNLGGGGGGVQVLHIYLNAKVSQPFNICIFFSMVHVRRLI